MTGTALLAAALVLGAGMQSEKAPPSGVALVEAWVEAMNALDGTEASVERLVALYHPDALHVTGPEAHQIGTVTFDGAEAIAIMASRYAEAYERIVYRIDVVTANETSRKLFHVAEGPWRGESIGVQLSLAATRREDGVRVAVPAAAFFRIEGDRIRRARIYVSEGERAEVEPLPE